MDRRASDRKLCVSLSSAPEVTARRHTDHATICRFADCIFFRADPRGKNLFVFRTVGHRPWIGDNFPRRGKYLSSFDRRWEKVYKGDNKGMVFSNDLESVGQRFFFFSLSLHLVNVNIRLPRNTDSTNSRKISEICSGSADWYFEMRRVPLRHASFNRIHILIRRHCERGQMLVTIRHCIRSFRLS